MTSEEYVDDYEGDFNIEDVSYKEDPSDVEDTFEQEYDKIFDGDAEVDEDVDAIEAIEEYDRDMITGRRSKRPKMSVLNKSKLTKQELDDLFLE